MIVTIHQPEYIPWLGFFDRIIRSDIFVVLDHVQYQKNGFMNRNRIKNASGSEWITIPVLNKFKHSPLNQVPINNENPWREKHYKSIVLNYCKAPHFEEFHPLLKEVYGREWTSFVDLDMHLIVELLSRLGIKRKILKSSEMDVEGTATDLLVAICKKAGADAYLSGEGGKRYLEHEKFEAAGIPIHFQAFTHPVYSQQHPKVGFISHLSFIDLVLNHGQESLSILNGTS